MITVKLTTEYPHLNLERFSPAGSLMWGNCKFVVNQPVDACDYWMVIDGLLESDSTICPPENVILFTAEPPAVRSYSTSFVDQFSAVVTCQPTLRHRRVIHAPPPLPWYMDACYEDLTSRIIEKSQDLMMIVSNKQMTTGHRQRYAFALKLKAHFGDNLELYGRGIREVNDKWEVQSPARFAVCIENSRFPDYFSEKITDCFLTETFPFYDGCPNISAYFPKGSLAHIDIEDFAGSIRKIEAILSDSSYYSTHLPLIREAKERYLRKYSLFALLSAQTRDISDEGRLIKLRPEKPLFVWNKWQNRVKRSFSKVIR